MAVWEESDEMRNLALRLISARDEVSHIDIEQVLFLKELETKPPATARCYRMHTHPIGLFTDKPWAIVFYIMQCDYMSEEQLTLLMFHELMHIPPTGDKLVNHNIQDFREVLGIDIDWAQPGQKVPDILEGDNFG